MENKTTNKKIKKTITIIAFLIKIGSSFSDIFDYLKEQYFSFEDIKYIIFKALIKYEELYEFNCVNEGINTLDDEELISVIYALNRKKKNTYKLGLNILNDRKLLKAYFNQKEFKLNSSAPLGIINGKLMMYDFSFKRNIMLFSEKDDFSNIEDFFVALISDLSLNDSSFKFIICDFYHIYYEDFDDLSIFKKINNVDEFKEVIDKIDLYNNKNTFLIIDNIYKLYRIYGKKELNNLLVKLFKKTTINILMGINSNEEGAKGRNDILLKETKEHLTGNINFYFNKKVGKNMVSFKDNSVKYKLEKLPYYNNIS